MVNDEVLETHIVEGERCQRHPRTLSSPVSCDEGSLRARIPQTRIQRRQPRPRHQQHQRPHFRPRHQLQCPPPSRTHHLPQLVPLDLPQDSPRLSLQHFHLRDSKRGKRNSNLNSWFIVRLGRTNLRKEDDTVFGHTSQLDSKNVANKLLHGGFVISFMEFNIILTSNLTNLSASNNVRWHFKDTLKNKTQNFLNFKLHFQFVYHSSTLVIQPIKKLSYF